MEMKFRCMGCGLVSDEIETLGERQNFRSVCVNCGSEGLRPVYSRIYE